LAANVRMPYFGIEFHDRRPKGVVSRYLDIDAVVPSLIWCAWWALEGTLEMCQVVPISHRISEYVGEIIRVNICNLLRNAASAAGSHGYH